MVTLLVYRLNPHYFQDWGYISPDREALEVCSRRLGMRPEQLLYNAFGMVSIPQGLLLRHPMAFITSIVLTGVN